MCQVVRRAAVTVLLASLPSVVEADQPIAWWSADPEGAPFRVLDACEGPGDREVQIVIESRSSVTLKRWSVLLEVFAPGAAGPAGLESEASNVPVQPGGVSMSTLIVSGPLPRPSEVVALPARAEWSEDTGAGGGWSVDPAAAALMIPATSSPLPLVDILGCQPAPGAKVEALPELPLTSLDGSTFSFPDLAGRPVVVELFATWCQPCHAALADLAEIDLPPEQIVVVAVDSPRGDLEKMVQAGRFPGRLVLGTPELVEALGRPPSLPVCFLADSAGRVVEVFRGSLEVRALREALAGLGDGGSPPPE